MNSKKFWDWEIRKGDPGLGRPSTFSTETSNGYEISVTLQENEDGVLVCSELHIDFSDKLNSSPKQPINSRFFQILGLGEILATARMAYRDLAESMEEVYGEMEIEREVSDWSSPGNQGFPDEKYAAVAYMYVKFVKQGLESPIAALADYWGNIDRNTVSSRVLEARARGLLTTPKAGTYGGKLTAKAEKLLPIKTKKRKGK